MLPSAGATATWDQGTESPSSPDPSLEKSDITVLKRDPWVSSPGCDGVVMSPVTCKLRRARRAWFVDMSGMARLEWVVELSGVFLKPFRRHCHHHHRHTSPSYMHRLATTAADCASILAGGVATHVILNFNQSPGAWNAKSSPTCRHRVTRSTLTPFRVRNLPTPRDRRPLADRLYPDNMAARSPPVSEPTRLPPRPVHIFRHRRLPTPRTQTQLLRRVRAVGCSRLAPGRRLIRRAGHARRARSRRVSQSVVFQGHRWSGW